MDDLLSRPTGDQNCDGLIFCIGLIFANLVFSLPPAASQSTQQLNMKALQERFCEGMVVEWTLASRRRVDCLSLTHAIEVDWAEDWTKGIGQALAYSAETTREPGIILICKSDYALCNHYSLGAQQTLSYWRIKATMWNCLPSDATLNDCRLVQTCHPNC
jgi:hypothetical protein